MWFVLVGLCLVAMIINWYIKLLDWLNPREAMQINNVSNNHSYDKESDILYVSLLGAKNGSYYEEVDDYLVLEKDFVTHKLTGYRLLNYTKGPK